MEEKGIVVGKESVSTTERAGRLDVLGSKKLNVILDEHLDFRYATFEIVKGEMGMAISQLER